MPFVGTIEGVLTLFRRHIKDCPHTTRRYRRCGCPIWVAGSLRGERIKKSLDLTSWEAASDLIARWHAAGEIGGVKISVPSVAEAVTKFLDDCKARGLKAPTIKKLTILLDKRLLAWCESKGYLQIKQLDVDAIRRFRATWPDSPISAFKNLERLRSFFHFCVAAGWVRDNAAKAVKMPKLPNVSQRVKVFTPDDIEKILKACDRYPQHNAYGHDNRARIRALVLALRYTGLRIGDAVGLRKQHLTGDKLMLRTQKSGTPVFIPVPPAVVEALKKVENGSDFFFWTGNGLRKSAVADWQRAFRTLFELADISGHAHMFRHSFATELLSRGVPIEDVAILLGHASPAITAKYYSHFVKARRERLEERVREIW